MKNYYTRFIFALIILTGACFTACHNSWIEPWWTEENIVFVPEIAAPDGSGDNFGVVIFDTDGGTPQPKAIKIVWGSTVGRLRPVVRGTDGFAGWFDENGNEWDIESRSITKADDVDNDGFILLSIRWVPYTPPPAIDPPNPAAPVYIVNFDPYPGFDALPANAVAINEQYIAAGSRIVQPVQPPVLPDDRGFAGWYTNTEYTSQWDFNFPPPSDVTLYAKWEINTRKVLFNANGGTRPDGSTTLNHEFSVSLSYGLIQDPGPLIKTGYSFGGWYVDPGFSGLTWNFNVKKITDSDIPQDGPLTLYARWIPNIYFVTFVIAPSTAAAPEKQSVLHGGKVTQPPNPPSIGTGESFSGWYTEDTFENTWDFTNGIVTSSMNLYAKYLPQTRTVVFKVNGGNDMSRTNFTIPAGNKILDPGSPVRTGYTFRGWFFDPACTPGNSINFTSYIVTTPDEIIGMDALYLYAGWTINPYTVKFFIDGSEVASQPVRHGEHVQTPELTSPVNKTLDGWYSNSSFSGSLWDFNTAITSSISLYARWLDAGYVVRYYLGTGTGTSAGKIPQWDTPAGQPYLEQYYRAGDRIIEPYMPALGGPNDPADHWSFLRWDCAFPVQSTDLSNINNASWRNSGNLHSYNRFGQTIDDMYTVNEGSLRVLNLYARWVPPVPDMVWVPRGSFTMGDSSVSGNPAAYHAYPTRRVRVDGFYISKYEVTEVNSPNNTIRGYAAVMGTNPSQFSRNTNRPVERVSWYDAIDYCMKLSTSAGLSQVYSMSGITTAPISGTGSPGIQSITNATVTQTLTARTGYRLPTEAEWEYAARGGNGSPGNFTYSGSNNADTVAWYNLTVQAEMSGNQATQPAGSKQPNGLGIYDMSGNVSEWCWDWFASYKDSYFYTSAAGSNPIGPPSGTERVRRGGGWSNAVGNVRSVVRNSNTPDSANWVVGFRVVRGPSAEW